MKQTNNQVQHHATPDSQRTAIPKKSLTEVRFRRALFVCCSDSNTVKGLPNGFHRKAFGKEGLAV